MSLNNFRVSDGSFELKFLSHLAKAKDTFPHINQKYPVQDAHFQGSTEEYIAKHENNQELSKQMKNKVRKCPKCGKPNAFSLVLCNGCAADISKTEMTYTNNVFTGFIYGIQKGPYPFFISLRYQDEHVLTFDDLLSLTPTHFNCIPTTVYIPDWRYLLKKPKEGLELVNKLFDISLKVFEEQFWSNKAWCKKIYKDSDALQLSDIKSHIITGLNYPPSQYQLHLQFLVPPFTPYTYYQCLLGVHFTYGRFFPLEYVQKILQLNEVYDVKEDTDIETIIKHYDSKGVNYHQIHKDYYERSFKSHQQLSNWSVEDFEAIVMDDKVFKLAGSSLGELTEQKASDLNAADKMVLQNYGRPYNDGKTTGTFYKHSKQLKDVAIW
eukprot:TRINITY_DN1521_c0_g1_i2.p1 TRINITY_DN1521_c0_g1~~TRINITY_DN1521_c0_g1_i2.p1  ORF type:complete len:400 (+),score=55.17 TRINITY_DN1521_c0_g1_i2:61-1200(+)